MAWIYLVCAGLFEVVGTVGLNRWSSRRDAWGLIIICVSFLFSFSLLTAAMQDISMGTAYAVWTGIGSVGATVLGMIFYGESRQAARLFFLALVIAAAVGLKLIGE
ncbi:DMT family transporter [Cohnella hashimotonis]|uniref:Multidrug efflux SMR transporter n=1 Tax=Cohnella hashimotonis TaxID=2826895 RepID=A0ABT6TU68_9BACL|nr:multidrug efflux SMR transporter [Cohnella hashimotonis]MDI4650398.1 multidrug efflux SMR transporter [Cohnella hashimotonis]